MLVVPGIRPVGVAAHIGSQLFDLAPLEAAYIPSAEQIVAAVKGLR